ncbi:MAG: hypothetical protein HY828_16525 [Actinobacteria bacterium]|nr:hypothetical protein [Actinomycetota bacterium]
MSNLPPPQFPPPQPPESGPPQSHSDITELVNDMSVQSAPTPWFKRPFLKLPVWAWLVAVVALVGVGVGLAVSGGDDTETLGPDTSLDVTEPTADTETTVGTETTVEGSEPTITEPDDTTAVTEPIDTVPSGAGVVAGAPAGERGTQDAPVAAGGVADVGSGWRLQVLSFVADGAAAVAAENEFNDPPPAGKTFTLVKVALGYYGLEDPAAAYTPTINALGADKVQLETSCGVIPEELPVFTDLFAGGVVVGNLCFVTTPADGAGMLLYANADFFGGDDSFLATSPPAGGEPAPMPTLTGPQDGAAATADRLAPNPVNTGVDVGDGWALTVVGGARDITDAVLAENSFNEPPPAGFRFVGVDVTYSYSGEGSDVALTATTKAVALTNVELSGECGIIPGEVDLFSDVFAGGSVTGTICFVVPEGGFDMVLYTTTFVDDFVHHYFATK